MVADGNTEESDTPQRVLLVFGDENARPKVVRTYDVQVGWVAYSDSPVLTWRTVDDLIARGSTSVELKWRSKKHQVSLLDLRTRSPTGRGWPR